MHVFVRLVGSTKAHSVSDQVHSDLAPSADLVSFADSAHVHMLMTTPPEQLSQAVGDFGATCEGLLVKYRKDVIRKEYVHL